MEASGYVFSILLLFAKNFFLRRFRQFIEYGDGGDGENIAACGYFSCTEENTVGESFSEHKCSNA